MGQWVGGMEEEEKVEEEKVEEEGELDGGVRAVINPEQPRGNPRVQ